MQSEEQRLIDGLFSRLKEAGTHSASRDASAEERIAQHMKEQPAAPYYMAQTILIQEAAIKQLNDRIQALESQVTQLQAAKPSSGGSSPACLAAVRARLRPDSRGRTIWSPAGQRTAAVCAASAAELCAAGGAQRRRLYGRRAANGGRRGGRRGAGQYADQYVQRLASAGDRQYHRRKPQPDLSQTQELSGADDPFRQDDDQFLADNNTWNSDFDAGLGNDDDFGSDDDSWV
jgi:polyhydroxyalkanoate synthesis regulator phasin